MSDPSRRPRPTGYPTAGPSPSSVRIVESDDTSRQPAGRNSTTRPNPSAMRLTSRLVVILAIPSVGLALFDFYLLLSSL